MNNDQRRYVYTLMGIALFSVFFSVAIAYFLLSSKEQQVLSVKKDFQKEKKDNEKLLAEKKSLEEKLSRKLDTPAQVCNINDEMKKLVADSCTAKQAKAPVSVTRKKVVSVSRVGEVERVKQALDLARLRAEAHREIRIPTPIPSSRSEVKVVQDHCIFRVDGRIVAEKFVPEGQGGSQCPIWREAERESRKLKQKDLIWDKKYPS